MTFYPVLLLRYPFEITEVNGGKVALGVEDGADAYHGIIKLNNDPAAFMFERLKEGITLPELIKACMDRYNEPVEEVGPQVMDFLDKMKEQKLIIADTSRGLKVEQAE